MKEHILAFMGHEAYKPLTAEDLAQEMNLKGKELNQLFTALSELEKEALIIKTRANKYGTPGRLNLSVGRLEVAKKGFGFLIPADANQADIYITADNFNGAMNGDKVVARVSRGHYGRSQEGEIIRIVARANKQIVGTYVASRKFGFILPDDKRINTDIFVALEDNAGAKGGQRVVVEITKWPHMTQSAEGRIVNILGNNGDQGIEIAALMVKHELPQEFPQEVNCAAEKAPRQVSTTDFAGRRDFREQQIVTIDGEDAKDMDDAVNVTVLPNGHYLLGVHIADVSYYVTENSVLDLEARKRATSVYLVDRVIPMLPPRLSNVICSLNAGEDRLAMSIEMEINIRGRIVSYDIFPSVINVRKRLTYNIVRQILTTADRTKYSEYSMLFEHLASMQDLCKILRRKRLKRGAIDFDFPEIKGET